MRCVLQLVAAESLFADDTEDPFTAAPAEEVIPGPVHLGAKKTVQPIKSTDPREDEDAEMEDHGEDLDGFIVDDRKPSAAKKGTMEEDMAVDDMGDGFDGRMNGMEYQAPMAVHDPFVNGCTEYDEDGQRYLLLNEICGVIVRKQDVSSNPMEMNNIMNSLNNRKYIYELGMFRHTNTPPSTLHPTLPSL